MNRLSAQGYETGLEEYTRVVQYMRLLLWEGSSANTSCPQAMQDGATRLLQRQLAGGRLDAVERRVFQNAFNHLMSRDPKTAWTSGQWMTERTGGSDVSQSETVATYAPLRSDATPCHPAEDIPLGPWSISGFKWFSSATDSNMAILLARTPKGLSAFYAPMRRFNPSLATPVSGSKGGMELNGVSIARLKNKMGTKSLPTAELELNGMRAWLIGEEGRGIPEISTILTITRIRTAVGALGYLSRSLAVARAFAKVRQVGEGRGGRVKLVDSPLHMRTLSDMTMDYHGMMLLTFYSAYVMGLEEHPKGTSPDATTAPAPDALATIAPPKEQVTPLLRVLTPLLKAYCSKRSIALIYACMESLGGVGYLENSETEHLNVARIFRDACVLSIWEGTTDVLSTDLVRALKHPRDGPGSVRALDRLITTALGGKNAEIADAWRAVRAVVETTPQADLLSRARDTLWKVAEILIGALYIVDLSRDDNPRIREMCRRYIAKEFGSTDGFAATKNTKAELALNQVIVFGDQEKALNGLASRL
jgi:alkylation response protein AidB-like acyl-CoA dehydrogenase